MATPTHVTEAVDLSWVEFSEQDDESCESNYGCSNEAVWLETLQCPCKQQYKLCDSCAMKSQEYLDNMLAVYVRVRCARCMGHAKTYTHEPLKH